MRSASHSKILIDFFLQLLDNGGVITVPPYALDVLRQLTHYGYKAYVVGGCVRDSLLGRVPADWDVCTDATPEEMLTVFRKFRVFKTGLKHGTITVRSRGQSVEVTTFRTDGDYSDNRHPDAVTFVSRVEDDLARRDFTINAMAYHPDEGLVDAFGGQQDLDSRTLRCVGEPDRRFQEDGLRILRALRFAARFELAIERETSYAIHRNRHLLENISAERIFKELHGILCAKGVGDMLTAYPGVFGIIIPELATLPGHLLPSGADAWAHTVRTVCATPAEPFALRMAMLLHCAAAPTATPSQEHAAALAKQALLRLKSDNATLKLTTTLVQEIGLHLPDSRPTLRRIIGRLGADPLLHIFTLQQALSRSCGTPPMQALCRARLVADELLEAAPTFTTADLAISGNTLIDLGIPPGPALGRILSTLLSEVQDELIPNTREALLARVPSLSGTSVK